MATEAASTILKLTDTIVHMLNALGDRSYMCPDNTCETCEADAYEAWASGLRSLGYEATGEGWRLMMRDNYPGFPTEEEFQKNLERIRIGRTDS